MDIPVVAIVGRPNVGKSTIFNRFIRRPTAITHDRPGVTRDRIGAEFEWNGRTFLLMDTGGYIASSHDGMERAVTEQCVIAIEEADVVLFLVDVKTGVTDQDEVVRDALVRRRKPVVLGVNKIDRNRDEIDMYAFYNLGLGDPYPVSGITGRGTGDLLDAIVGLIPDDKQGRTGDEEAVRVAIIGRPNVGKSSLVNAIVGRNAVIVSDTPGTTRDSTDTRIEWNGERMILVDTAGLRRTTKLKESIEYYSTLRTVRSLARCDVAVVVIDISEGLSSYDKSIIDDAASEGKGLVIAANKWDLVEKNTMTMKLSEQEFYDALPDKSVYPIFFISAKSGQRVKNILDAVARIQKARRFRVPTADFNKFIETLPIPPGAGDISIRYGTQSGVEPPTFVLFMNDPLKVKENFTRYAERAIRDEYDFGGTPIRLVFKK